MCMQTSGRAYIHVWYIKTEESRKVMAACQKFLKTSEKKLPHDRSNPDLFDSSATVSELRKTY